MFHHHSEHARTCGVPCWVCYQSTKSLLPKLLTYSRTWKMLSALPPKVCYPKPEIRFFTNPNIIFKPDRKFETKFNNWHFFFFWHKRSINWTFKYNYKIFLLTSYFLCLTERTRDTQKELTFLAVSAVEKSLFKSCNTNHISQQTSLG